MTPLQRARARWFDRGQRPPTNPVFPSLDAERQLAAAVNRLKSTTHLVEVIARAIYRTHFGPPAPSWYQSGPAVQRFFVAQARYALGAMNLAQGDPDRRANLVNEVAKATYDAHRRPNTPIWDRTTPQIRTWVTAQAEAMIAALAYERSTIRDRRRLALHPRGMDPLIGRS